MMELIFFHIVLLLLFTMSTKSTSKNSMYDECSKTFSCGDKDDLGYPFYDGLTRPDYCSYPGFKLDCSPDIPPKITISDHEYYLKNVDNYTITVSRNDTWQHNCPDRLTNTTMDSSKFNFSSTTQNITFFYDCQVSNTQLSSPETKCSFGGFGSLGGYYLTRKMVEDYKSLNLFENCNSNVFLPVLESKAEEIDNNPGNLGNLIAAFEEGFELDLIANNEECGSCMDSNGLCGYDLDSSKFVCHCDDHGYNLRCGVGPPILDQDSATTSKNKGGMRKITLLIGVIIGVVAISGVSGGCLLIIQKPKRNPQKQNLEDSLKHIESLVPKRYTYKYVKKMTKSFREKLGEGGYGTVFKGNLKEGCVVAVKLWKQSKEDDQDFINEIMSISRTSHVNIVPLLGFCYEGRKRALIYEFMPNGSLEKFLQGTCINENNQLLSVEKLFKITVGIARGLEYLHRGCNTRIVHFDIKPHNILLDEEFTPKISDFGLAKSSKKKESIISMSGVRGTVGYIAPELILKSFGGVSHKSDVYSFGMMVLEMVGCKKRLNENEQNTSEMYFPQWIYKQLEQGTSRLDCENILNVEEKELERKMILIGLACIQTNPMSRPSITRVVEMLEGKVELLEVPPMPTLSSPPRLQQSTDDDSSGFLPSIHGIE